MSLLILLEEEEEAEKTEREYWVHPINEKGKKEGEFHTLVPDLKLYPDRFYTYFRMDEEKCMYVLEQVDEKIHGMTTNYREALSSEHKRLPFFVD